MKKLLPWLLLSALLLTGCAGPAQSSAAAPTEAPAADAVPLGDHYVNWYEVFVWSFADSDGDGIGDLNGLTGKLDYIRSLGCGGLWLMPVMPSPSYHKYDVTDYCAVDPLYGTLDDMRALLSAAHERGLRVILDLPVNHSSDQHPWFLAAAAGEEPYRDYYVWRDGPEPGYSERNGAWYESRFVDSMPDLNLDNPAVREEIAAILRFWLEDVGCDGFRLDAVTSYYTGNVGQNVAFLDWLADTAHAISPDCFLVGEAWENLQGVAQYAQSRVDSFFLFPASQSEGFIAKVLSRRSGAGAALSSCLADVAAALPEHTIPAPFLENHDTGRTVGFTGRSNPARTKMAGGILCTLPGAVFVYYGQEIGMAGSGADPNKRIGMLWTTQAETTQPPPGADTVEYPNPSAAEQEADADSILNYYKAALAMRNRFPAIARGRVTVIPREDDRISLTERVWEDERLLVAVNPSRETAELALDGLDYGTLADALTADGGQVALTGGVLTLPGYSIAILTAE